jgi:IPT/TIG domain
VLCVGIAVVGVGLLPLTTFFATFGTGCEEGDELPGVSETDKLLLVERGGYYGHANRKRGQTDPRQCVWRSNTLTVNSSDSNSDTSMGFTAPLMRVRSSTCGIIEFESDHFDGQMRGDLILSKYNSDLYRVVLDGKSNGRVVNIFTDPAVALAGNGGLAVTQAPDGSLIDARHTDGECYLYKPIDETTTATNELDIKSVFPRRGGLAGGSKFMIFGVNFKDSARTGRSATETATEVSVTVGERPCTNVVIVSERKIECLLPPGTVGRKDVVVSIMVGSTERSDTFVNGYRYITGLPAEDAAEALSV